MANSYFQFKQFRVEQGECAMKVCTDACVLGAVAAVTEAKRILDVGTGTGLLALMVAQRSPTAFIDAVELNTEAAAQAAANFRASPWHSRLTLHLGALAELATRIPAPYEHIICNPPFFRNSLRSPSASRTTARHTAEDSLTFAELAQFAADFLTANGQLTVLLPPPEMQQFEQEAAAAGLFPHLRLALRHRPGSKVVRHITEFTRQKEAVLEQELPLHEASSEDYSEQFRELLGPFYLAL